VFPRHYPLDNAHAGDSNCHSGTAATAVDISPRCKKSFLFFLGSLIGREKPARRTQAKRDTLILS
jgi:hypothetical protein